MVSAKIISPTKEMTLEFADGVLEYSIGQVSPSVLSGSSLIISTCPEGVMLPYPGKSYKDTEAIAILVRNAARRHSLIRILNIYF